MYITTRSIAGGALMAGSDCGQATGMAKLCKTPLQSATDMLKHMAVHKAPTATARSLDSKWGRA
jgi:hypothetical protein